MAASIKKISLEDLYQGMRVKESQLSNILDTYFILINSVVVGDTDIEGDLAYFGNGNDAEYKKWFMQDKPITPLFFCKDDAEDGVVYDE